MILSSHVSDEKIFLFFSLLGNSIPNLVRLSGRRRVYVEVWKVFVRSRAHKNLPHFQETGSLASQVR